MTKYGDKDRFGYFLGWLLIFLLIAFIISMYMGCTRTEIKTKYIYIPALPDSSLACHNCGKNCGHYLYTERRLAQFRNQ